MRDMLIARIEELDCVGMSEKEAMLQMAPVREARDDRLLEIFEDTIRYHDRIHAKKTGIFGLLDRFFTRN